MVGVHRRQGGQTLSECLLLLSVLVVVVLSIGWVVGLRGSTAPATVAGASSPVSRGTVAMMAAPARRPVEQAQPAAPGDSSAESGTGAEATGEAEQGGPSLAEIGSGGDEKPRGDRDEAREGRADAEDGRSKTDADPGRAED